MAPRTQTAGNPSLRNRNRVTNKTRLKVIKGNIDADPIVLDEDEERARVVSTAGVDAEDANEHHLQAVLSAASHRATTLAQKASAVQVSERPGAAKGPAASSSAAFIPVPDAAGIVDGFAELYPPGKWIDYSSYIKFSSTVDECLVEGLNDGFSYVMDERDAEWLDKNNQEARGEGTSTQASAAAAGTTTRSGGSRSTKSKGKEAETLCPVSLTEDELELAMGLFEKITHDNTPFLHVSFQQQHGTSIPPFSDYHDVFANELPNSYFARFMHPPTLPSPPAMARIAKTVYPHWRERKIEREGQRIIPALNYDESDMKNESYICFRRRDTKAIRKTRAAQVSSSEKMLRLKGEIGHATELARTVLQREVMKKDAHLEAKAVWEKRISFLELKRKFPLMGGREDDEMLVDKERPPKRPKPEVAPTIRIKNRIPGDPSASPAPAEPRIRPKDRHNDIQAIMDLYMKRVKETDHGWDDQIDSSYQQPPVPLPDRYFKSVSQDGSTTPTSADEQNRAPHCLRMRRGRGGRMHFDRRRPMAARLMHNGENVLLIDSDKSKNLKNPGLPEQRDALLEDDRMNRLSERWRFDTAGDLTGADEEERTLIDDYDPRHMRVQALLVNDAEALTNDNRLLLFDSQTGSYSFVSPIRGSGYGTPVSRRDLATYAQQRAASISAVQSPVIQHPAPQATPVSQSQPSITAPPPSPVKMAPPTVPQHSQTPSNAPQRPPSSASAHNAQANAAPTSITPSNSTNISHANGLPSQTSPVNNMPPSSIPQVNGVSNVGVNGMVNSTNGLLAGLPSNFNPTPAQQQVLAMHQQQKQNLQMQKLYYQANLARNGPTAYQAIMNGVGDNSNVMNAANGINGNNSNNNSNGNLMGPVNLNLKLPAQRQMQWATAAQRTQSGQGGLNGNDAMQSLQNMQNMPNMQQLAGLGLLQSHNIPGNNGHNLNLNLPHNSHLSPPRSAHSPSNALGHSLSLSPHMGGSPAQAQQSQLSSHVSPSRNMQTPVPPSPSPLLQHQVPNLVGGMSSSSQGF